MRVVDYLAQVTGLETLGMRVVDLPWPTEFPTVVLPDREMIPGALVEQAADDHGYLPIVIDVSSAPDTRDTLRQIIPAMRAALPELIDVGNDPRLRGMHWAGSAIFGTRTKATALVGHDALAAAGLDGRDVTVMVIDQGFNASAVGLSSAKLFDLPDQTSLPGQGNSAHGMMVVRNLLRLAPNAAYFDIPLIPAPAPGDLPTIDSEFSTFSSRAIGVLAHCLAYVLVFQQRGIPCVLVNAWGIFNTAEGRAPGDMAELRDYATHRQHPLNVVISGIVTNGGDVVFAAGNCGQFQPDPRCGESDIGPERSVLGAASLAAAISIGAARVDTTWLGYSAQGRGQPDLGLFKPDLCAPSQFHDDDNQALANSGTSAAAAVAAGVVAALRSGSPCRSLTPAALKAHLISRARSVHGTGWDARYGAGLIDGAAALLP
jgi:subtilisin family serine protease